MMDNIQPMLMMFLSSTLHTSNSDIETKFIYGLISLIGLLIIGFANKIDIGSICADYINDYLYNFNKKNQVIIYLDSHNITVRGAGNTIISKVKYSDDYLAILDYITSNHKSIKNLKILREIMTSYMEKYWDDTDSSNFMKIPVQNEDILLDEKNKIYCQILTKIKSTDEDDKKANNNSAKSYDIRLYKWIDDDILKIREILLNFIESCKEKYFEKINSKNKENKFIYEYLKIDINDDNCKDELKYKEYTFESNKTFENLFFDEKKEMIKYVKKFIYDEKIEKNEYEDVCANCGITYKAGMLFYGEPGCGKTSAIKAILNYTNRVGIIVNLSKIKSNEELESVFRNYIINKKNYTSKQICFILEDCDAFENDVLLDRNEKKNIDQIIEKNKACSITNDNIKSSINVTELLKKDSFDFSCLLNVFDGMIELHGIMIIMTTNYPDKLDKALIREGRIDFKHDFKLSSKNVIRDIVKRRFSITDKEYNNLNHVNDLKDKTLSPAKIQSLCGKEEKAQDALNKIYEKQFI